MAGVRIDADDYRELYRRTRTIDPPLRKAFRAELKRAGRIGADAAKVRVRAMPTHAMSRRRSGSHGRNGSRGLRSTLASGIRVEVRADTVRIVQSAAGISGRNGRGLPRRLDEGGSFRHPVFGGPGWAAQIGWPYFRRTIAARRDEMTREVRRVLDALEQHLDLT